MLEVVFLLIYKCPHLQEGGEGGGWGSKCGNPHLEEGGVPGRAIRLGEAQTNWLRGGT